ncbi:MAG: hypothetical protein ACOYD0_11820 [Candidatus Nanopelagicales bacterium]
MKFNGFQRLGVLVASPIALFYTAVACLCLYSGEPEGAVGFPIALGVLVLCYGFGTGVSWVVRGFRS